VRRTPAIAASVFAACVLCLGAHAAVSAAQSGTKVQLSIAPIPTAADPSPGTPRVTWSTGDGSPGLVTVGAAVFASGPSGSAEAPWIAAGQVYEFRLYATGSGRRLLARLTIGTAAAAQTDVLAPPRSPRDTPAAVDRLLQMLPFAGLVAFGVLATSWLREVRRNG
jgi:AhpD family alkylhydroperoxidase